MARILHFFNVAMKKTLLDSPGQNGEGDCGCVRVMEGEIIHHQNCPRHDEKSCKACNPSWQGQGPKDYPAAEGWMVNGKVVPASLEGPVEGGRDVWAREKTSPVGITGHIKKA